MPKRPASSFSALPSVLAAFAGATTTLATDPFPPSINLSSLDGTNGFVITGARASDYSGWSVSSAGDFNGDGIDDILIGSPNRLANGQPGNGASYVVFGGPDVGTTGSINLVTLNGVNGFVVNGIDLNDASGRVVSTAGDVNGDGFDDILIGAGHADPNGRSGAGQTYVVFGGPDVGASGAINASTLHGSNGFVINGIDPYDRSGASVSAAGDINGDGLADILIGATYAEPNGLAQTGETYIVFGSAEIGASGSIDLANLNGVTGFVMNGIDAFDRCGYSVSSAGDVNGDGVDDLIVGAYLADPNDHSLAGESYVLFGKNTSVAGPFEPFIDFADLNGTNGFVINGIVNRDFSGRAVSSAGDVNGDSVDDILIGAMYAHARAGASYVIFGGPGLGSSASLDLSTLDGHNGFALRGNLELDESGYSVSSTGDVNGDGFDDILIGARLAAPNGQNNAGESYVVFGRGNWASPPFPPSISLSSLNGINGFALRGIDPGDYSGHSVASAGDINGDGIDDILIGAPKADPGGQSQAGESYVVFGRTPGTPPCVGDVSGDNQTTVLDFNILAAWFGYSTTPGTNGDLNRDGVVNVADFNVLAGDFGCAS